MHYNQDFKDKVVVEVQETKSLSTVARKHSIPTSTLAGWIKQSNKQVEYKLESSKKNLKSENKTLKKKLADAELVLMILKDLLKKSYNP